MQICILQSNLNKDDKISISAFNGPKMTVLSGKKEYLEYKIILVSFESNN